MAIDSRIEISDNQRKIEIAAVFATGSGKFLFMDLLDLKLPFIALAICGWSLYVAYRAKNIPGILSYWGFRCDNFWNVSRIIMPFALASLLICFAVGYYNDTIIISWHILPILVLYPLWGVVQQFLVIGLVAGNMNDLNSYKFNKVTIILITALLFGLLHYPVLWLMAATFILALLYGLIYLTSRNIYVMGLFHGWLGGIFFYTVVGRDPFAEVFGKYL
jgi:uncharacterized protein